VIPPTPSPPTAAPPPGSAAIDLRIYRCPTCGQGLSWRGAPSDNGALACPAGHAFAVRGGLPRFVEDEGYAASFGYQWQTYALAQRDSHTGAPVSRNRLLLGTGWPERMPGELILEAGCGAGRFTEVLLSTGARLVSFDYSAAADVAHADFGDRAQICQASIFAMPYAPGTFDRVFCYGVIQHTPDVSLAFSRLVQMARPGGHIAIDVYDRLRMWFNARYRVRWLTRRMPREQLHRLARAAVTTYMKVFPPMHPWNQLVVPLKDYRGAIPGLSLEQQREFSVLDTLDALSPAHDHPQYLRTMRAWCAREGLVDVHVERGGNGIEVRARRPA